MRARGAVATAPPPMLRPRRAPHVSSLGAGSVRGPPPTIAPAGRMPAAKPRCPRFHRPPAAAGAGSPLASSRADAGRFRRGSRSRACGAHGELRRRPPSRRSQRLRPRRSRQRRWLSQLPRRRSGSRSSHRSPPRRPARARPHRPRGLSCPPPGSAGELPASGRRQRQLRRADVCTGWRLVERSPTADPDLVAALHEVVFQRASDLHVTVEHAADGPRRRHACAAARATTPWNRDKVTSAPCAAS